MAQVAQKGVLNRSYLSTDMVPWYHCEQNWGKRHKAEEEEKGERGEKGGKAKKANFRDHVSNDTKKTGEKEGRKPAYGSPHISILLSSFSWYLIVCSLMHQITYYDQYSVFLLACNTVEILITSNVIIKILTGKLHASLDYKYPISIEAPHENNT